MKMEELELLIVLAIGLTCSGFMSVVGLYVLHGCTEQAATVLTLNIVTCWFRKSLWDYSVPCKERKDFT